MKSHQVYNDDQCVAFLDIHPINPGHVLVVPKVHAERFFEVNEDTAAHLLKIANRIYRAMRTRNVNTVLRCEGANIFLSDGTVAGQEVGHTHLHIAPRFTGDGHAMGFSHADPANAASDALENIAKKLKENL